MIFGMSLESFTTLHVVISLIGMVTGAVALLGMLNAQRLPVWTAVFLVTTVLTSVTGFLFPAKVVLPSHIVGAISLVVLAVAIHAYYVRRLAGPWRWLYVATALTALYLNVFVGVVQAFIKIGLVKALAPTQTELPFIVAQGAVLGLFVVLGLLAARRFHPAAA
jgi:hypothetical protein